MKELLKLIAREILVPAALSALTAIATEKLKPKEKPAD